MFLYIFFTKFYILCCIKEFEIYAPVWWARSNKDFQILPRNFHQLRGSLEGDVRANIRCDRRSMDFWNTCYSLCAHCGVSIIEMYSWSWVWENSTHSTGRLPVWLWKVVFTCLRILPGVRYRIYFSMQRNVNVTFHFVQIFGKPKRETFNDPIFWNFLTWSTKCMRGQLTASEQNFHFKHNFSA